MICGIAMREIQFRYFQCNVDRQGGFVQLELSQRFSDPNLDIHFIKLNPFLAMQEL